MKSELQLIEECIEVKTKEYQLALLETGASGTPWSSFVNVQGLVAQRQTIDRLESELTQLEFRRNQLLGDNIEQEPMIGSRAELMQYLSGASDGTYKIVKMERKDDTR